MGKVTDKAIRLGHDETWEDFQRNHPEVQVFFYHGKVVDIEPFSKNIQGFTTCPINGIIESVLYVYEGHLVKFPPN